MQIFISHFVFRRQLAEFFFPKKIIQMNPGKYKNHSDLEQLGQSN